MAIEWSPWFNVLMHRRLETISVGFFLFLVIFGTPFCAGLFIYLLLFGSIYWRIICGLYVAFYVYDWRTCVRGGRGAGVSWVRSFPLWKYCVNYFPIDMVKTTDLTPDRNYLICLFPHGMGSLGAGGNFATNYSKFSQFFPGVRPKLTTLRANNLVPILRELVLSCGNSSATADNLTILLSQSNDASDKSNRDGYTSNGVVLVGGGALEVPYTYPDTYRCVLKQRRGFARIALQTGASLVPAISFGENNTFKMVDVTSKFWLRLGVGYKQPDRQYPVFPIGRGLFQTSFGLIPLRHPITTVIGAPIHLKKTTNPNKELIDQTHELFCMKLKELFEEHKSKYVKNFKNVHLEIV